MPRPSSWHIQHVPTSAGELYVRHRQGNGIPLILWPSIFYDHSLYLGLIEWLENPLILLDGPGHGASRNCPPKPDMAMCAQAQEDILKELGIGAAVAVGTSWGGLVAVTHALNNPDGRIRGLILANTPFDMAARPALSTRAIVLMSRWIPQLAVFRENVTKAFFSARTRLRHPEVIKDFLRQQETFANPDLHRVIRAVLLERRSLVPELGKLDLPVLVIAGGSDTLCPLPALKDAAARIPGHHLEIIPDSGHISLAERPHESAGRIRPWLAEHFARAGGTG